MSVCHICKQKCESPNYTVMRVRVAGDSFLAPVHRECFEQHERAMLREAYVNSPQTQAEFSFREWLEINGVDP